MADIEKKEIILKSAFDVFIKKGFHSTKVSEIAESAGIGKGTIYEYFHSKKEIFEEAFVDNINTSYEKLKALLSQNVGFKEKLENYFKYKYNCITIQSSFAENLLAHGELVSGKIKDTFLEHVIKHNMDIIKLIEQGIEEDIVREDADKEIMLACIMGVSNTYIGTWIFLKREGDIDYNKIIDSILEGFGKRKGGNGYEK